MDDTHELSIDSSAHTVRISTERATVLYAQLQNELLLELGLTKLLITRTFSCVVGFASVVVLCASRLNAGDIEPVVLWNNHLFPSYMIASAATPSIEPSDDDESDDAESVLVGDDHSVLGVLVESPSDNATIELTITAKGWLEPSTITATLPEEGVVYRVMPTLKLNYAALASNKQSVPTTIGFRVKLNGKSLAEHTQSAVLHSINDCPFAVYDGEDCTEIGIVFAAYVNEQHPFIDKILRESLDSQIVDSFAGYQSHDNGEVIKQVFAVWNALAQRDMRYSSITAIAAESNSVACQHVRLLHESINNGQANCVDGSVVMASILRKINIEPYLVMVPGHCYLAFSLDGTDEHLLGLETTMIGSEIDEDFPRIEALDALVDEETQALSSYASFCAAIHVGTADLAENMEKFASEEDGDYQLISIAAARKAGVLPIAFQSDTEMAELAPAE